MKITDLLSINTISIDSKSSTAIGEGIAIPHCKGDVVKKP